MHLAIHAGNGPIGIQRNRSVVIKPRRAALKQRSNNGHPRLTRHLGQPCRGRAGNLLRKVKERKLFALAKVLRLKSSGRQTMFAPSRAASRMCCTAEAKFASGSGPMRICTRATVYLRAFPIAEFSLHTASAIPLMKCPLQQGQPRLRNWPQLIQHPMPYSSRIRTAAAIVVVHLPRLSPTADCVILLVRTILLEMR